MLDSFKNLVGRKPKENPHLVRYKKALGEDPKNINARLKLGDFYSKNGDKAAAIREYTTAAIQYADDGYLIKAIAVNKIIVRLDPVRQEALDRLSELYFQRGLTADPLVQSYREAKEKEERTKTERFTEDAAEGAESAPVDFTPDEIIDLHAEPEQEVNLNVYLEKLPFLHEFSTDTKRWLTRHLNIQEHSEGSILLHENRQDQSLFIVADGHANMITTDKEGQETVVTVIGSGGFFGGLSLCQPIRQGDDSDSAALTVKAATLCIILEIEHEDLAALAKREPEYSEALLGEYYKRRADIALARVPLFSYLQPEERRKIADHLVPENVKKGATIITEGDVADTMYIIKSGEVGIYTTLMEDESVSVIKVTQERLQLATMKDGDFFGEQALITKEPRNATIIAQTDVELLKFSKKDLAIVVRQYPRVGTLLGKYHQLRVAETLESLKSIW